MSATASPRPLITVAQVAALLGVNEKTVRRKIAAGEIPAVQLGGRRAPLRIPVDKLEEWVYAEKRPGQVSACRDDAERRAPSAEVQ
jgi:excisionase family DNA binding protein